MGSSYLAARRVATGLSNAERRDVSDRLIGNLVEAGSNPPPECYQLTRAGKEKPHFWVVDPHKSVVFQAGPGCHWSERLLLECLPLEAGCGDS